MEKPTIVKLTEAPSIRVATFEEAFGDHSEARGNRQAKKAAKQVARQTRKATKKSAKQAKKQQRIEAKVQRKVTRKVGRQEVKGAKQAARQDRRTTNALMKQDRRTAKTAARIDRRAMRRPDELAPEELLDENAVAMSDTPDQQSYSEPQAQYEETGDEGEGTAESDENYTEPTYHDDSEESDEEYVEEEYEEPGYDDEYSEDEYSAEGSEDFNGGSQFQYDSAEGGAFEKEAIDKEANVGEILNRIEANKVLIQRIIDRMNSIKSSMNQRLPDFQRRKLIEDMKRFKTSLDVRNNRAAELQMQLEAFSNASGKRAAKVAARQATKTAKVAAKQERKAVRQAGKTAKVAAKVERKAVRQTAKVARKATPPPVAEEPGVTEVEQGLNADIEEGRIEVPADETSSANGMELYAMGDKNEEFVPEDRIVEIKYGADGIGSGIAKVVRPTFILWGAGLYLAYLANKKYQFIKF